MKRTAPTVAPIAPVFMVEVIDEAGYAWLLGPLDLNEALEMSARRPLGASPDAEPRILIPPNMVGEGMTNSDRIP